MGIKELEPISWDLATWNWKELGLKSGVEIHQQLLTEQKLFCKCPARFYSREHDAEILRHMRPTLSELGEYDGTALMEFKKKKEILYLLNRRSVCTYEMDDTPPFEINLDAVDIALEIALLLECNIVGELHVIRKQYLDGSIPSGFQRTAIVGVEGSIPACGRRIRIAQVSVEEDSCREVSDVGHRITFLTDRLSMPLAEVVTYPDMHTPQEVAEVVSRLGNLMRLAGKVRRGAGSARQDVNVSVEGGARVEIKGVPSIRLIPALVGYEALRQHRLLRLKEAVASLEILDDPGYGTMKNITEIVRRDRTTGRAAQILEAGLDLGAVCLPGVEGVLQVPVNPNRTLLDEVRGRVRVIGCIDDPPFCVPGDEWRSFGMPGDAVKQLRHLLKARRDDALVLVYGKRQDVETSMKEVVIRVKELRSGVVNETRQVLHGGETDFERILPGPDRMYPDTDSPPTMITDERIARIKAGLTDRAWEREDRVRRLGLPPDKARRLSISPFYALLVDVVEKLGIKPSAAARILIDEARALRRRGIDIGAIPLERLAWIFEGMAAGRLFLEGARRVLETLARSNPAGLDEVLEAAGIRRATRDWVKARASEALASSAKPSSSLPEARERYYMGLLMKQVAGSFPGAEALKVLRESAGALLSAGKCDAASI